MGLQGQEQEDEEGMQDQEEEVGLQGQEQEEEEGMQDQEDEEGLQGHEQEDDEEGMQDQEEEVGLQGQEQDQVTVFALASSMVSVISLYPSSPRIHSSSTLQDAQNQE